MRIIAMGTGPFAVPSFDAVLGAGHDVALVVTRPQRAVKSRKAPPPSPVRQWASDRRLEIIDPPSINDAEAVETLRQVNADLLAVCDYGQILKPEALATTSLGGINLHGSLLPAYRGAAPVQRALLAGERLTGVSVIHMSPKLDAGPILATRSLEIDDRETSGELEERLARLGVDATSEAIEILERWDRVSPLGHVQDPGAATKAPRLHKSEGEIDWARSSRDIDRHVRGMQPWPVAFTHVQIDAGKPPTRVAITEVATCEVGRPAEAEAGDIVSADELLVATGDGVIEIKRLRPAGRREMTGQEFLRGHAKPDHRLRMLSPTDAVS